MLGLVAALAFASFCRCFWFGRLLRCRFFTPTCSSACAASLALVSFAARTSSASTSKPCSSAACRPLLLPAPLPPPTSHSMSTSSSSIVVASLCAVACRSPPLDAVVPVLAAIAAPSPLAPSPSPRPVSPCLPLTSPAPAVASTSIAVVASIGSCDDGHVFVVFAAAIVAAVADVIAATVADGVVEALVVRLRGTVGDCPRRGACARCAHCILCAQYMGVLCGPAAPVR